jgi:hypothetical protein
MPWEDTGLTVGLKPGFNDRVRRVHARNTRWNRRRHLASANPLTETIRLRIPKVASQAEAREDGTHLIGLRTSRFRYNLSGSQESRKLNHVCKSFLLSWFPDERFDLVCDTFLDEQSAIKSKK